MYNFVFLIFVDQFWNCGICGADAHEKTQTLPLVAHELSKVSVDIYFCLPTQFPPCAVPLTFAFDYTNL